MFAGRAWLVIHFANPTLNLGFGPVSPNDVGGLPPEQSRPLDQALSFLTQCARSLESVFSVNEDARDRRRSLIFHKLLARWAFFGSGMGAAINLRAAAP